ncbi:hypothetical protein RB595_002975 [Gaeumannomyces hyphopodioides]
MASSSATGPDTIISLKVTHDGIIKKLKLPLRDLGASTLDSKLREMLVISPDTQCTTERYSDSAASYVTLDPTNAPVFKQLYRAAKAKQKLKLRVTTITPPSPHIQEAEPESESKHATPNVAPRPVTIEDVPDAAEAKPVVPPKPSATLIEDPLAAAPAAAADAVPPLASSAAPRSLQNIREDLDKMAKRHQQWHQQWREENPGAAEGKPSERVRTELASLLANLSARTVMTVPPPFPPRQVPTSIVEAPKPTAPPAPAKDAQSAAVPRPPFAVYCNSCDRVIPDTHYHCSTCDDGDFDLCQGCVDMGIACYGDDHWLIKRMVRNGMIVTSTTERKAPAKTTVEAVPASGCPVAEPKATPSPCRQAPRVSEPPAPTSVVVPVFKNYLYQNVRTCNNCVQEFPEHQFVHCTTCFDFDLCKSCFVKDSHGHHPRHGFISAVEGTVLDRDVASRLAPGRNQKHNAICDGCDKFIQGVRHKCLDCPDWDYCADCVGNAGFIHPNHRFVPIYDPLRDVSARSATRQVHLGIHCDGPLCRSAGRRFVHGDRYKCAVCHDTDFCANCEASPANTHNKTHPMLKFKTPVRNVNVVTTGEREDGRKMPVMGDRLRRTPSSRAVEAAATKTQNITQDPVQTVLSVNDAPPSAPEAEVKREIKEEVKEEVKELAVKEETPVETQAAEPEKPVEAAEEPEIVAEFECDTIADGTVMPPNHIFEQTWVLRNAGKEAWPAGCSVKYVGGDYMGHVNSNHPAGVKELISASESTICYAPLAPGQSFSFTVLLRTPPRDGKVISYWRLTSPAGLKFGHRLWCDVEVKTPKPVEETTPAVKEEPKEVEAVAPQAHESQMIFPKLEKESPVASVHKSIETEAQEPSEAAEEFEDCNEDEEWDESEDGFMTDEEYDILDASDEEFSDDSQKKSKK